MGGVGGGLEKLRLRLTQSQFGIELRLTGTELGKKLGSDLIVISLVVIYSKPRYLRLNCFSPTGIVKGLTP